MTSSISAHWHVLISRRRFNGLLLGSAALAMTGCGGGGSDGEGASGSEVSIASQPGPVWAAEGEVVTLEVVASGSELSYQWLREGVEIAGATASLWQFVMQPADHGARFAVRVSDGKRSVVSDTIGIALTAFQQGSSIALLAGGLGGQGWLPGRGDGTRIVPWQLAARSDGTAYAVCQGPHLFAAEELWADQAFAVVGEGPASHPLVRVAADGEIQFVAWIEGGEPFRFQIACDSADRLHLWDGERLLRLDETGSPAWQTLRALDGPFAFDPQDRLYFWQGHSIRLQRDMGGDVLVAGSALLAGAVDGSGTAARLTQPGPAHFVALPDGRLLLLSDENVFRFVTADGEVSTLQGPAPQYRPVRAAAVLDDSSISTINRFAVFRVALDGQRSLIAGAEFERGYAENGVAGEGGRARFEFWASRLVGIARLSDGRLVASDGVNALLRSIDPATGQTAVLSGTLPRSGLDDGEGAGARFERIGAMAIDASGVVHIVDRAAARLRRLTSLGTVSTAMQDFPADGGLAFDRLGNTYGYRAGQIVRVGPDGQQSVLAGGADEFGFADGDGADARFQRVVGLLVEADGSLLVLDAPSVSGGSSAAPDLYSVKHGGTVRRVTPTGRVTTIAGVPGRLDFVQGYENTLRTFLDPLSEFDRPAAMALDAAGNLHVADANMGTIRILRTDGSGTVLENWVAGLPSGVRFKTNGLVVDAGGTQYFATSAGRIYRRRPGSDEIRLVAGSETSLGVRTGPLPGSLNAISALALAPDGSLLCASENSVLRIALS